MVITPAKLNLSYSFFCVNAAEIGFIKKSTGRLKKTADAPVKFFLSISKNFINLINQCFTVNSMNHTCFF